MESNEKLEKKETFLILQGENQYGVLDTLMREFQHYLQCNYDYEVKRIDLVSDGGVQNMLSELSQGPKYIFCLEGICFDAKTPDGKYIMQVLTEVFQTKVFGWIVDSSFYHSYRLRCMNHKMKIGFVDRNEALHAEEEYGVRAYTVHHFGIESENRLPISERKIDVFIPCTCKTAAQIREEMLVQAPDPFDRFLISQMAELMNKDENKLNWEALQEVCSSSGIDVSDEELDEVLKIVEGWADVYYRSQKRDQCLLAALNAGVNLTVCGRGWDRFAREYDVQNGLEILGEDMSFEDVLHTMDRSKTVLNICPSYKEAIHERACTSMLRGAVCITDPSEYLLENFEDGASVLFYQWNSLPQSFERIKKYLSQEEKLQKIADEGYKIAKERVTIANFTKEVLEIMEREE